MPSKNDFLFASISSAMARIGTLNLSQRSLNRIRFSPPSALRYHEPRFPQDWGGHSKQLVRQRTTCPMNSSRNMKRLCPETIGVISDFGGERILKPSTIRSRGSNLGCPPNIFRLASSSWVMNAGKGFDVKTVTHASISTGWAMLLYLYTRIRFLGLFDGIIHLLCNPGMW